MRRLLIFFLPAILLLVEVLVALEPAAAQQDDFKAFLKRFDELRAAGNYPAALIEAQKLQATAKARFGTNHQNYAVALFYLAVIYQEQGTYVEAEAPYRRALAIMETKLGKDHPAVAETLINLGDVYEALGKYSEAEVQQQRALAIRQVKLGKDHPDVALVLNKLANVYKHQDKYAEAEALQQRALVIREVKFGKDHPGVADVLNDLANLYAGQGKYAEAEAHHTRALAIREQKLGREHSDVAKSLGNLANVYRSQAKYADAEAYNRRALEIFEKTLGKDHPTIAECLSGQAQVYVAQGRYAEAETYNKRALAIMEAKLGKDDLRIAMSLRFLAEAYRAQRKYVEAEANYKRALEIDEARLGNDDLNVTYSLNGLGLVYQKQRKYAEAEAHFKRALAIREMKLGDDHPSVADILYHLAVLYRFQDKYAEAERHFKRALAIMEAKLGKEHPRVASSTISLANLHLAQRRYAEAEAQLSRALALYQAKLVRHHPDVAVALNNLALVTHAQGKYRDALAFARKASAAVIAHAKIEGAGSQGQDGLVEQRVDYFTRHLLVLAAAAREDIEPAFAFAQESFDIAQWAVQSTAAAALAHMAARHAKGEGPLAQVVREHQDLERQWRILDGRLNDALGKGDVTRAQSLRREMDELEGKLTAFNARLTREFPDYAELSNPKPLPISAAQPLLGADEALLFWVAGEKESYVFALTHQSFDWKTIPLREKQLSDKIAKFRRRLDVDAVKRGLVRTECTQEEAQKRGLTRVACGEAVAKECEDAENRGLLRAECSPTSDQKQKHFDLALAHELYAALIGPIEPLIKDKKHLLVVPSGALTALPFHLLVTEKPAVAVPDVKTVRDLAVYRDAAWLLKRHAVTVLPSVASLKALRVFARKEHGTKPLVGFGDPVFNPEDESKTAAAGERVATRSYTEFWQGVGADRAQLRKAARLPETAYELSAVAKNLGAPASDVHLRVAASETTVKRLPLSDYKVVYFATHGLVAGEVKGLGEPSLLLTLPKEPSETDDGLLTASEVAQLKLNADWVVLSACNTIAGDKPGAEALSGLARAFFYAGARALLVSHWAVDSNAATLLTTSTFDILKSDPKLGRAEALRQAMLNYMNDASNPRNAYPAYWAPFVVVGEGVAR